MAILGSKGSGKKALLDVIACRAEDSTRGQVLLNGSTLTKSMFQHRCGYVTHNVDFIAGLTVSQTLHYTPTVVGASYIDQQSWSCKHFSENFEQF